MGRACSMHGEKSKAYRVFVGKPEGKRPLRRLRCRCEDNNKMDLTETGWGGMDWITLSQDMEQWQAPVNMAMNLFEFHKMLGNF
jgi:hypothetical protein